MSVDALAAEGNSSNCQRTMTNFINISCE